jgi:signal transduction histidine kinase/ActR/RegA family two-component response regulator
MALPAPALRTVFQAETWRVALERYGAATGTTVAVYETPERLILGPVYPTPLFETMNRGRDATAMFSAGVRDCLAQNDPVVIEEHGVALVASSLRLGDQVVGAVVAGYGLTAFPEEAAVRRFTLRHDLAFLPVWRAIRRQAPLTSARVTVYAELLAALTDTLLSENARAHDYAVTVARLAHTNQAKDQFLAMLAHELRNPLAPIQIAVQVISTGEGGTPALQKARQIVDRQVQHLSRLLDDLLDVSRITTGKVELRKEPVNLAAAVANALDASRSHIEQREHCLSVSLPEEPIVLDADPTRFEQVITNLVNNAAKYTAPHGHISVTARRENDQAVLSVRDDGMGIAPDLIPHVFDLFTQADRSLVRAGGGLGIGLTIVRSLVELHGGTATVESEGPGRGSEFIIRLPLGRRPDAPSRPQTQDAVVVGPLRVLVIEDNADSRDALRAFLELDGHHVEVAEDGVRGADMARAARPDVALIDIGLPGLDGYEVARRIRDGLGKSLRLFALTGYGRPEDRRRATEAGFDAHLVKPVSPEALRHVLAECYGLQELQRTETRSNPEAA